MKISIAPRPTVPSLLVPALAPVLGPGSSVAGPGPPPAVATSRSRSRPRATLALLSAVEVSAELPRDRFQVHEVTKSRARALATGDVTLNYYSVCLSPSPCLIDV